MQMLCDAIALRQHAAAEVLVPSEVSHSTSTLLIDIFAKPYYVGESREKKQPEGDTSLPTQPSRLVTVAIFPMYWTWLWRSPSKRKVSYLGFG